jgi:septal ring factor EnvC (AmiA/AmiB activator)
VQLFSLRVNLEESLHEAKQHYEEQITNLKQERENEGCKMKKVQRENDNKKYEIESLKLELKTVEQNLEASRENMKELGNRCCTLIEQETENQVCYVFSMIFFPLFIK